MKIQIETAYAIGDNVRIPYAHTEAHAEITDVLVQATKRGLKVLYYTNNVDVECVMEESILGLAPVIETVPETNPARERLMAVLRANKPF